MSEKQFKYFAYPQSKEGKANAAKKDTPAPKNDHLFVVSLSGQDELPVSNAKKSGYWRKGKGERNAIRAALRKRIAAGDGSAKAQMDTLMSEAEDKVARKSNENREIGILEADDNARKDAYEAAERANRVKGPKVSKAIQLYQSSHEATEAEREDENEAIRLSKRTPKDMEKEIKEGRRLALQEKLKSSMPFHGAERYSESEKFALKLADDKKRGVTKSPEQKKAEAETLRKLLLKESLKSQKASEEDWKGAEDALTTEMEGAEAADARDAAAKAALEEKRKAKAALKAKIDKEAYAPDGLFDEMQDPEAVKLRQKAADLREKLKKKKYRRMKVDPRLKGGPKPKNLDKREAAENARLKKEASH